MTYIPDSPGDATANSNALVERLTSLQNIAETQNGRLFWDAVRAISQEIHSVRPLHNSDRQQLRESLNQICADFKLSCDQRNATAVKNAEVLSTAIEQLRDSSGTHFLDDPERCKPEYHNHSQAVSRLFKELKPLRREDRERLWQSFNDIRDAVQRNQTRFVDHSRQKREGIEQRIKEAYWIGISARELGDFSKADAILEEVLGWMKDGWEGYNLPTQLFSVTRSGRMTREDHQFCWNAYKQTRSDISSHRRDLQEQNYRSGHESARHVLQRAYNGNIQEVRESIKECNQQLKGMLLTKEQRQDIRELLDQAWQELQNRSDRRKREWVERQQEWIARTSERIEKNQEYIERLEQQVEDLQDKLAGARTQEFAERVQGWINEKYQKMSEVHNSTVELEEKLAEAQEKLRRE